MKRLTQIATDTSERMEINMSPLIDMVFLLLIFFMVTTVFVQETGVQIDRPRAVSARQLEEQSVMLALTPDGRIYHGGREVGLNDVRSLVRRQIERMDEQQVVVLADETAATGLLIQVIDECKLGGAARVSVAAQKDQQDR